MAIRRLGIALSLICLVGCSLSQSGDTSPEPISSDPTPSLSTTYPTINCLSSATRVANDQEFLQPNFTAEILFSTSPDASKVQRVFPAGTQQIYAIWGYANMREGQIIRKEWYCDGEPWLYQEGPWDLDRYGSDGQIKDISIFDFDQGIQAGSYDLYLYIDDQPQSISEVGHLNSFRIVDPWPVEPIASPDGMSIALVKNLGTLIIQDPNGQEQELLTTGEISSMAWVPTTNAIVYTDRDRTQQRIEAHTVGRRDELWIVNVETKSKYRIGEAEENYHSAQVSPDGRFLALLSGTGYGDALFVDLSLVIMELDQDLQRAAIFTLVDFPGFQANISEDDLRDYVIPVSFEDAERPGRWLNATQLLVGLEWLGVGPQDEFTGIYLLDLDTMKAERIGELFEESQGL